MKKKSSMKMIYKISSDEMGIVLLRKRKIAKAFRWWLRENGVSYISSFYPLKAE